MDGVGRGAVPGRDLQRSRTSSPSSASACSPGRGSSSPTSPRCHGPATSSCAASSTTRSSSAATTAARCTCCSTCAGTGACRSAGPRPATPRHFRCPYHAWTYRNDGRLVGVPFHAGGLRRRRRPRQGRARPADARRTSASYRGLVFANLDPAAPPLEDALGDFRLLPRLLPPPERRRRRAARPAALAGAVQLEDRRRELRRRLVPHAAHPRRVVDIGLFREPTANKRKEGALYLAGGGGGTTYKLPDRATSSENLAYVGYPPEMVAADARGVDAGAAGAWSGRGRLHGVGRHGLPEPQLRAQLAAGSRAGEDVVPFVSMRLWQPVSATETECCSWFAVDAQRARRVQGGLLPRPT